MIRPRPKSIVLELARSVIFSALIVLLTVLLLPLPLLLAQEPPLPRINNIYPSRGAVGTPVMITGSNFGVQNPLSYVTFNGVRATANLWTDTVIITAVPEGATTGPVVVTVLGTMKSNEVMFEVTGTPPPPEPSQSWYLAEGSTAYGFETFVLIENVSDVDASVTVVYNTEEIGRVPRGETITVPKSSRVTLNLNDEVPNVNVSTYIASTQPIVCERAMYWNNRIEGHESIGVTTPSKTWYFAEGSSNHGFETWLLVQNPGAAAATVNVTYFTDHGVVKKEPLRIGAGMRATISAAKDIGARDFSVKVESDQDVVCERAMYWGERRGGHSSIGVTDGSKSWYLAEGSTAWGFETWLLLGNPNQEEAGVNIVYQTSSGPLHENPVTLPPGSRKTILVNERVKNMDTSIKVTSDKKIIAERAMYWDNGTGKAGHETVGFTKASKEIFFAEGSTAWGFETYLCIQNPSDKEATVSTVFLLNKGPVGGPTLRVPALSRITLKLNDVVPNVDVAVKLIGSTPIMAERAMYWNNRGGGHCSIGFIR